MRVLYGVVGEGMGHATRSRVVLQHLVESGHEVEIMTSGRAKDFLAKHFEGVNRIHGLQLAQASKNANPNTCLVRTNSNTNPN